MPRAVPHPASNSSRAAATATLERMRADSSRLSTSSCHRGAGLSAMAMPASSAYVVPCRSSRALTRSSVLMSSRYPIGGGSQIAIRAAAADLQHPSGRLQCRIGSEVVAVCGQAEPAADTAAP